MYESEKEIINLADFEIKNSSSISIAHFVYSFEHPRYLSNIREKLPLGYSQKSIGDEISLFIPNINFD